MIKKFYVSALLFCTAISLSAQSTLDLQSRAQLRQSRLEKKMQDAGSYNAKLGVLKAKLGVPSSHALGIIRLASDATVADLESEGVNVLRCRYGFAFVSVPLDDVERVSTLKAVSRMQLARPVSPKMDKARVASGVEKIHQGIDLPQVYTGKGVVCGIVDGGIDPNHVSFRGEDGNSRVGWMAHITVNPNTGTDLVTKYYNRDEIYKFTTDDNTSYHGTHTLGIMAGGYKGVSSVADIDGISVTTSERSNPYYGVAYDADITAVCGELLDMIIMMGVDYMIQYAEYENKPLVINLSLGGTTGAHDGTGLINQFFDYCAKEYNAIICVAAGNEGDLKIALNKTFAEADPELKTFIEGYNHESGGYVRYGNVTVYSDDDTPFDMQAVVYNKKRGSIVGRYPLTVNNTNQGTGKYWVSSSEYQESSDDMIDQQFGNYFDGYVGIGWDVDAESGRFYAMLDYYAVNNIAKNNADGNYLLGFVVTGNNGQRVDCFCDGSYSWLSDNDVAGWDDGMKNGSISDMATGNSTLVVGAYNTREEWGALDGGIYQSAYNLQEGEIAEYSSYGTLADGRNLPHVCAPGGAIIAPVSSCYVDAGYADNQLLTTKTEKDGNTYYWGWGVGTSMATPYVAGSIALWLEADPTLTIDDIKDIIDKTAVKDDAVLRANSVQAGAGKFDAYAGLKEVIRRATTGIGNLAAGKSKLVVTPAGDRAFKVFLGGVSDVDVVLFSTTGKTVMRQSARGDEITMDVSSLPKGVYVLNVNKCHSQRIVVK